MIGFIVYGLILLSGTIICVAGFRLFEKHINQIHPGGGWRDILLAILGFFIMYAGAKGVMAASNICQLIGI